MPTATRRCCLRVDQSHLDLAGWYHATSRACATLSLHSDDTRYDTTAVVSADGPVSADQQGQHRGFTQGQLQPTHTYSLKLCTRKPYRTTAPYSACQKTAALNVFLLNYCVRSSFPVAIKLCQASTRI